MRKGKRHVNHDDQKFLDMELPSPGKAMVNVDPLRQYMFELKKYKMLSPDEQKNLAIRFKENDEPEAIQLLVVTNLRLVFKIAKDYQRPWMQNLQDLIQEGNLGLMRAALKFDPSRNPRTVGMLSKNRRQDQKLLREYRCQRRLVHKRRQRRRQKHCRRELCDFAVPGFQPFGLSGGLRYAAPQPVAVLHVQ